MHPMLNQPEVWWENTSMITGLHVDAWMALKCVFQYWKKSYRWKQQISSQKGIYLFLNLLCAVHTSSLPALEQSGGTEHPCRTPQLMGIGWPVKDWPFSIWAGQGFFWSEKGPRLLANSGLVLMSFCLWQASSLQENKEESLIVNKREFPFQSIGPYFLETYDHHTSRDTHASALVWGKNRLISPVFPI